MRTRIGLVVATLLVTFGGVPTASAKQLFGSFANANTFTPLSGTAPSVTSYNWSSGRADAFAVNTSGELYTSVFSGGGYTASPNVYEGTWSGTWSNWASLGTPSGTTVASSPFCRSRAQYKMDCFMIGADGNVHRKYYNSGWHWDSTIGKPSGVTLTYAPTFASWTSSRMDLFVIDTAGNMHTIVYTDAGGWGSCCCRTLTIRGEA